MKPWARGPEELLNHAVEHIQRGSSFDNRIAFISIDNATELIIRTYLGLPKRIRKTDGPSRKTLQGAASSFPDLLDVLEEHGSEKLEGIDLGDIEWYHRLRNTLYHEGSGVTVDAEKVDSYLQIARILFKNLLDEELATELDLAPQSVLGEIVLRSSQLEHNVRILYRKHFPTEDPQGVRVRVAISLLAEKGVIPPEIVMQVSEASAVRNEAVHSPGTIDPERVREAAKILGQIVKTVSRLI